MSSFNFLRRINRGIALGIALVIGLSCYLVYDGIAFKDEREAIKQTIEDYIKAMESFMILPGRYREIGVKVPDSIIEKKLEENKALVSKYFSDTRIRDYSFRESVFRDLEYMLKDNQKTGDKVKNVESKIKNIKSITKHGSNLVTVEATVTTTMTATQSAGFFNVFYSFGGGYYMKEPGGTPIEKVFINHGYESTFTCEMIKQNGSWVFSSMEGMSSMYLG